MAAMPGDSSQVDECPIHGVPMQALPQDAPRKIAADGTQAVPHSLNPKPMGSDVVCNCEPQTHETSGRDGEVQAVMGSSELVAQNLMLKRTPV